MEPRMARAAARALEPRYVKAHSAVEATGAMRLRGGGEAVDISGDGGVLKEVLEEGASDELPERNDDVCVHYVGTLQVRSRVKMSMKRMRKWRLTCTQLHRRRTDPSSTRRATAAPPSPSSSGRAR
jgi:FKBP-type peptidyl-prolyl cis-trans isomerase